MDRLVCIHGHFYQPPRENPWIGKIERQDSAYPYHDWNERVDKECYTPNAAARILDDKDKIVKIICNYEYINFNFGPTLLDWMKLYSPSTYQIIIEADAKSAKRNNGHGNAIAQVYNHIIMPLAKKRDKEIQIKWGIENFLYHFKRRPEGMWLAETAVDTETLELLAENGIRFTILSPYQAANFRLIGAKEWTPVAGAIDSRRHYICRLPSGRDIVLFFYDPALAQDTAFGGLLNNGEAFYQRLRQIAFSVGAEWEGPALSMLATDGETYGHHHKFTEMGLAYAINKILEHKELKIANCGYIAAVYPPMYEVQVKENSSWSCSHGVERWRSDCGCRIGYHQGWNQKWRAPLRNAVDILRERVYEVIGPVLDELIKNREELIDSYILAITGQAPVSELIEKCQKGVLTAEERVRVVFCLEALKYCQFSMTSCGWFFDDISGIEPVQNMKYMARCIQYLSRLGKDCETEILDILSKAKSNIPEFEDGAWLYKNFAKSSEILEKDIVAHFVIYNLFLGGSDSAYDDFGYSLIFDEYYHAIFNDFILSLGEVVSTCRITGIRSRYEYCVLYTGAHDVRCSLKKDGIGSKEAAMDSYALIVEAFDRHNLTELIRAIDAHFGANYYTLEAVLIEARQQILDTIVKETIEQFEDTYESLYDAYEQVFHSLVGLKYAFPLQLALVIKSVLNKRLLSRLTEEGFGEESYNNIISVIDEIERYNVSIDVANVKVRMERLLNDAMRKIGGKPVKEHLAYILRILAIIKRLRINVDLWDAQNIFYRINQKIGAALLPDAYALWKEVGSNLNFKV